jgi:hypothetical protein
MSDWDNIPSEDVRVRPPKEGEYVVPSVGVGDVICSRPGVTLIDFYRTHQLLAKDVKPKEK